MRVGKLRNLLEVRSPTSTSAGGGNYTTTYVKVGEIWADMFGLSERERSYAAQQGAIATHQIVTRWDDSVSITPKSILVDAYGREYHVVSVIDPDGRRRERRITAVEEVT